MKQILFVDDQPGARSELKSLFGPQRRDWDIVFAPDGGAALEALGSARFDVIVADVDSASLDGAVLLEEVKQRFPHMVRVALTGEGEFVSQLRALPVAHQAVTKPCESGMLREVVDRILRVQTLVENDAIRAMVGDVDTLPALPESYRRLSALLDDPSSSLREVAAVVEHDMAISAKLLQLVNSAFFGLPRRVTSVAQAVSYLGVSLVKNLVLSLSVFSMFTDAERPPGFSLEAVEEHSFAVASVASGLCGRNEQAEDAFMAGLLQDIGKLILAKHMPEQFVEVMCIAVDEGRPMHELEVEHLGVTHAEIGAYLLGIWGLPVAVVEGVANHHCACDVVHRSFEVMDAVYVAHVLVQRLLPGKRDPDDVPDVAVDVEYLDRIGVAGRYAEWERWVRERAEAGEVE